MWRIVFNGGLAMAVGIGLSLACAAEARAAITSHSGSNDPVAEGFITFGFGGGISAGVAPDATASWQIVDATGASFGEYDNTFAGGDLPAGSPWKQTVRVRVESNTNNTAVGSFVYDGATYFQFFYTTSGLRYFDTGAGSTFLFNADNNTNFRTYDFQYDPVGNEIDVSLDGIFQTSVARASFFQGANTPQHGFGALSNGGESDSRWASVTFAVPEPGTMTLMTLGGVYLLIRRYRRQGRQVR